MNELENPIYDAFLRGLRDARIRDGFRDECRVSICFWILEVDAGGAKFQRMVYAWAIPTYQMNSARWFETDPKPETVASGTVKYTLRRASAVLSVRLGLDVLRGLLGGQSLGECATSCGLPVPAHAESLRLMSDSGAQTGAYEIPPISFQSCASSVGFNPHSIQPESSPADDVSAYVHRITCLAKSRLWTAPETSEPLPDADEILRRTLSFLQHETGLRFESNDSGRLGNFEWLVFPLMDEKEGSRVSIETINRDTENFAVHIALAREVCDSSSYAVRCRLCAGGVVFADHLLCLGPSESALDVPSIAELDTVSVSISERDHG